jgi:hypothetical protein
MLKKATIFFHPQTEKLLSTKNDPYSLFYQTLNLRHTQKFEIDEVRKRWLLSVQTSSYISGLVTKATDRDAKEKEISNFVAALEICTRIEAVVTNHGKELFISFRLFTKGAEPECTIEFSC